MFRAIEYGLALKIVTAVGKRNVAAATASAAILGAADAWARSRNTSLRALDTHVAKIVSTLSGMLVPNPNAIPRSQRQLTSD